MVVLIDLLAPAGWRLAEERLIDTLIGCAIVLLVGFAPWPMAWYAHLPRQFAETTRDVSRYMEEALLGSGSAGADAGTGEGADLTAAADSFADAAVDVPGPGRPAGGVSAHHVRATLDQP